jgi:hypothetical protein
MIHSFPSELSLSIISEVINGPEDEGKPSKATMARRLAAFRQYAAVCKAWLDPARTVFWKTVAIFSLSELASLARFASKEGSKPQCIQRLYLTLSGADRGSQSDDNEDDTPFELEVIQSTVERYLPTFLHMLSGHLDMLEVDCKESDLVVLQALQNTHNEDPSWFINIEELKIGHRSSTRDVFSIFTFARNVQRLVLKATTIDMLDTWKSPCAFGQLKALDLTFVFEEDEDEDEDEISEVAGALTHALKPACESLESFTLGLPKFDRVTRTTRVEVGRHLLSLGGHSTSFLRLYGPPATQVTNFIGELNKYDALPLVPALQRLELHDVAIAVDIFEKMGCMELRQLEMTMKTKGIDVGTSEALAYLTKLSLETATLPKLEKLEVNVKTEFIPIFILTGLGPKWEKLRQFCTERDIDCSRVGFTLSPFGID